MMKIKTVILGLSISMGVVSLYAENIRMQSDNVRLQKTFQWAVEKSQSFRMTGKKVQANVGENGPTLGYKESVQCIPSYWAGYANRTAFYARDFSRQSLGAHLVGLDEENFSMFKAFAGHCTEDKKWYTWWALNFDGTVYTLDAPNPPGEGAYEGYPDDFENPAGERFVREVPANFNLIYNSYKCYLWTGDTRYVSDVTMRNFRNRSMNDFFLLHDSDNNGIPEGIGDIWVGSASYNERDLHPREAGDAASLIYAARLAYAGFLADEHNYVRSEQEKDKAKDLYVYFNTDWSRLPEDSMFVSVVLQNGKRFNGFSRETTFLMPIYGITSPGNRTDLLLDFIREQVGDGLGGVTPGPGAMPNIESYTYLPQLFFAYNRVEDAYKYIKYIIDNLDTSHELSSQGSNREFPEVAFTMVSNLIEGMMGVQANAPQLKFSTVPRLPRDTHYVTVHNINIGQSSFDLTHRENKVSEIIYQKGKKLYIWEAAFYGEYKSLCVDGKIVKALHKEINGEPVSYVEVRLNPGDVKRVSLTVN